LIDFTTYIHIALNTMNISLVSMIDCVCNWQSRNIFNILAKFTRREGFLVYYVLNEFSCYLRNWLKMLGGLLLTMLDLNLSVLNWLSRHSL
jgi:hypothetical protein